MFGGVSGNAILNDTWVWDGVNWTQMSPANKPPARSHHAMVYDSGRAQMVMFGGSIGTDSCPPCLNDTWTWDGSNWIQRSPVNMPPPRKNHAMAFDGDHGQVVLFGGDGSSIFFSDTWVWDEGNWTQEMGVTSPGSGGSGAMAYDGAHKQVVLFDGSPNHTWVWDGAAWMQETPQTSPPPRNVNNAVAYDAEHDQIVLFGGCCVDFMNTPYGDTWTWNGGSLPTVITAVVNGASFVGGGVVPGEIATAFGTNLTSSTGINLTSSLPLPTTFEADSLTVNNQPVALFAVDNVNGQQQINFQVPWEVASGPNATIAVSNNGATSASVQVLVVAAQPGIFNYTAGGNTFGAILHANFVLADSNHPAAAKETVLIYCTGLGAVSLPPADGAAGNGQPTMVTPTVTIGGTKAIVSFSGLAPGFVGLYQVNAEVPAGLAAGNQPVVIAVAGSSSNTVLLPVL